MSGHSVTFLQFLESSATFFFFFFFLFKSDVFVSGVGDATPPRTRSSGREECPGAPSQAPCGRGGGRLEPPRAYSSNVGRPPSSGVAAPSRGVRECSPNWEEAARFRAAAGAPPHTAPPRAQGATRGARPLAERRRRRGRGGGARGGAAGGARENRKLTFVEGVDNFSATNDMIDFPPSAPESSL